MNRHNSNNDEGTIIDAIGSNGAIGLEPLIKEPILSLAAAREAGETSKRYPGGGDIFIGGAGRREKIDDGVKDDGGFEVDNELAGRTISGSVSSCGV